MLKRKINILVITVLLFSFSLSNVFAYDYVEKENQKRVENMIREVYELKDQYEDLAQKTWEEDDPSSSGEISSDYYWWPIGSAETQNSGGKDFASDSPETIIMTSPFGNRPDPFGSGQTFFHSGIDIAGGRGLGQVNIIAAKDGVVVFSSKGGEVCTSGSHQSTCGGGYGNYIIIQHTDGNYTLYGHLYEDSLTVKEGESVKQGQVIAKMGSSGNSTGAHLHFEVREGQNDYSATVDPLNYVDPNNPRPANASSTLVEFIEAFEGHTKIIGDSYLVEDIGDGVKSVGKGVVLEYNAERFAARGYNVDNYSVGSTIPISVADSIKDEIISEMKSSVESVISKNGISLKPYQIDALVSFQYNVGNINEFPAAYKQYGDTEALYDNFFGKYVHVYGEVWLGLVVRRKAEWYLFHTGQYTDGWQLM